MFGWHKCSDDLKVPMTEVIMSAHVTQAVCEYEQAVSSAGT